MKYFFTLFLFLLTFPDSFSQTQFDTNESKILSRRNEIIVLSQNDSVIRSNITMLQGDIIKLLEVQNRSELEKSFAIWIPISTLLAAVFTIFIGWKTIKHYHKIKIYELIINVTTEYATCEMLDGILKLRNFEKEHKDKSPKFDELYGQLRESDYEKVRELDCIRRKISHFFQKIHLLVIYDVVHKKELMKLLTIGQINVFLELILPLEKAIAKNEIIAINKEGKDNIETDKKDVVIEIKVTPKDYNFEVFKFFSDLKDDMLKIDKNTNQN